MCNGLCYFHFLSVHNKGQGISREEIMQILAKGAEQDPWNHEVW